MNGTLRSLVPLLMLALVVFPALPAVGFPHAGVEPVCSTTLETAGRVSQSPHVGAVTGISGQDACSHGDSTVCTSASNLHLFPGDRVELTHSMYLPALPADAVFGPVDILFLQDETWTHEHFVLALKEEAGTLFDDIRELMPDSRLGVAGFRDFPQAPWGSPGDWPFRLVQDLTFDREDFIRAVELLDRMDGGGTDAGSQYEALSRSIVEPQWRPDALKIVILATHTAFHTGCEEGYPGPCGHDVIADLERAGILVHGLRESGAGLPQLSEVAEATGGTVTTWCWDGTVVFSGALVEAMEDYMPWRVTPVVVGDPPVEVAFDPASLLKPGERWVTFAKALVVPQGTPAGSYALSIEYRGYYRSGPGDETAFVIAEQLLAITVFDSFDWITMVYIHADSDHEQATQTLAGIGEAAYYGPVRTVVLVGGRPEGDGSYSVLMSGPHGLQEVEDVPAFVPGAGGAVDAIGPGTLAAFVKWARERFPADNYALFVQGGGCGWGPPSSGNNATGVTGLEWLWTALGMAVSGEGERLEVVVIDTCFMPRVETAYRTKDAARYLVAAASVDSASVWPYAPILSTLAHDPGLDGAAYAVLVVEEYARSHAETPGSAVSAVDLAQMIPLVESIDALALALLEGMDSREREIALARSASGSDNYGSIDLHHFAGLLSDAVPHTAISETAASVESAVEAAVTAFWTGAGHLNMKGLAVYYPDFDEVSADESPVLGAQAFFYESAHDLAVPEDMGNWVRYVKRAPRLVQRGCFSVYVPDVLIVAVAVREAIVRLDWPEPGGGVKGFVITSPVSIVVTPEEAISAGMVALLYTRADLRDAGIVRTQLIGQAFSPVTGGWELLKLTMDLPEWPGDFVTSASRILGKGEDMDLLLNVVGSVVSGLGHYDGAVIGVPWTDLDGFDSAINGTVTLGIIATADPDYLTPIQYPQNLYEGWNLISLPVIPLSDVEAVIQGYGGLLPGIGPELEVIWTYDAAAGRWRAFSPAAPEASDLRTLKDGVAYWVKMKADATLTVLGSNMLLGPHLPPVYELVEGWNLIGYKGILPMPVTGKEVRGYLEGVSYWHLQGYDRVQGKQTLPAVLQPNEGYWVYASRAGKVPGIIEDSWVRALTCEADGWLEAVKEWVHLWSVRDPELGARLAWNVVWYAVWVIEPAADSGPLKDWVGLF